MRHFLVACLAPLCVAPALAQASRETLAGSISSALDNNPGILAQRKTRAIADEALEQANAGWRPTIGLSGGYTSAHDDPGLTTPTADGRTSPPSGGYSRKTAGLEVRQTLYAGGALSAQVRQAEAGVSAARSQLNGFEQQLVSDVVTAFVDVRRAEAEVEIRKTNVSSLKEQVTAATERFRFGDVTKTDVAQTQARQAGAEADLSTAEARLEAARANFQRLVGRPAIQLAELPPVPPVPVSLKDATDAGLAANPALLALRASAKAASEAVEVVRGSLRPNVGIVGNAGVTNTYNDNSLKDTNASLTARLSIPLYQGGLASSRTRSAQLAADKARYDVMSQERLVTAQVTVAWHSVISARQGIAASRSRIEAAEIAFDGAKQELAIGNRITLDVLDQQRELLEARLSLVDAQRAEYVAVVQLLASLGRLGPQVFVP